MKTLTFELRPVPPFRLDFTAWALRRRSHNAIDRWDGTTWRRVLVIDNLPLEAALTQVGLPERPRVEVNLSGESLPRNAKHAATTILRKMFGLIADLDPFYRLAAGDKRLGPLADRFRGLKPPRFPSVFEGLINAIACQQLSLTVGIWLLNRMAEHFGLALENAHYAFPRPRDLLRADPDTLRVLGFSYAKARNAINLSQMVAAKQVDPEKLEKLSDEAALELLLSLRGVGRWTAEYVLLRGLGRINIFPGDDVGARNRLARWLGRDEPMDYEAVSRAVRRWRPYAGFVYFHMLLDGLAESGVFAAGDEDLSAAAPRADAR